MQYFRFLKRGFSKEKEKTHRRIWLVGWTDSQLSWLVGWTDSQLSWLV